MRFPPRRPYVLCKYIHACMCTKMHWCGGARKQSLKSKTEIKETLFLKGQNEVQFCWEEPGSWCKGPVLTGKGSCGSTDAWPEQDLWAAPCSLGTNSGSFRGTRPRGLFTSLWAPRGCTLVRHLRHLSESRVPGYRRFPKQFSQHSQFG